MTKKTVFGVAVVALAALVMVPSASATCASIRSANTYNAIEGGQAYWISPIGESGNLVGQTWQLGAPATWSTGNCTGFLYFSVGGINLNLEMSSCGAGCPAPGATLAVLAQNQGAQGTDFLVATIGETPARSVNYDYSTQGNHNLVPMPRPRVTSSNRAGSAVNLGIQVPAASAGLYGPNAASAISGYNILSASSATNPGRNAAAYTLRATIPAAGGGAGTGAVTVDCTNTAQDQWVVTQIQFENGGVLSSAVSDATRINCNPALADPKYKIVPKRGTPKQGVGTSN